MTPLAPALPFDEHSLEPHLSGLSVAAHFQGYHRHAAQRLADSIRGTDLEDLALEKLIDDPVPRGVRTLATQVWNHAFLWRTLAAPQEDSMPPLILELLVDRFGGVDEFRQEFRARAHRIVGSGWLWLALDPSGHTTMLLLSDSANPLAFGYQPLLGCDLWEHAYYLDYRDDRDAYLDAWWKVVDWGAVDERLRECRRTKCALPLK